MVFKWSLAVFLLLAALAAFGAPVTGWLAGIAALVAAGAAVLEK